MLGAIAAIADLKTEIGFTRMKAATGRDRFRLERSGDRIGRAYGLPALRLRSGVTLVEILLVFAILIMVAAIAMPILSGTFEGRKLRLAADVIRGEWAKARVQSIRSGKEWVFVYQPGTGNYSIQPYNPFETPTLGQTREPESQGNFDYGEGLLPVGVLFEAAQTQADTRSDLLTEQSGGSASGQGSTSFILFYPDGSAQQSRLRLFNDRQWYVQLDLRALTGTALVSDILSEENGGSR